MPLLVTGFQRPDCRRRDSCSFGFLFDQSQMALHSLCNRWNPRIHLRLLLASSNCLVKLPTQLHGLRHEKLTLELRTGSVLQQLLLRSPHGVRTSIRNFL